MLSVSRCYRNSHDRVKVGNCGRADADSNEDGTFSLNPRSFMLQKRTVCTDARNSQISSREPFFLICDEAFSETI
jgi:hypothetical protein